MFFHLMKNTLQQGNSKKSYCTTEYYESLNFSGLFHPYTFHPENNARRLISKKEKKIKKRSKPGKNF